jgi:hypothetical protein
MSTKLHVPAALPMGKAHGIHWIGGCLGPRAGSDDVEKRKFLTLPGLELRLLGRPTRSQSLYKLRYPGLVSNDLENMGGKICRGLIRSTILAEGWRKPRDTLAKIVDVPA